MFKNLFAKDPSSIPAQGLPVIYNGAHDRNRTDEPLPYQGSALPTELRGHFKNVRVYLLLERETRFELATSSLEG